MNNLKSIYAAAALLAVFASCSKEATPSKKWADGLSITVGQETKAYLEGSTMKWVNSDSLVVFDNELNGVDFKKVAGATPVTFQAEYWTGNTPTYAANYRPHFDEVRIHTAPGSGIIPLRIRATQNSIQWKGCSSPFASAAVGKVEYSEGNYTISAMKNVVGFISFTLISSKVAKIKVSSAGTEPVCGWVNVDYTKLINGDTDFWTIISGTTPESAIILTPSSGGNSMTTDGCFVPASYSVAVLPQAYASGLVFTLLDKDGETIDTQTIGAASGVTVQRGSKLTVSKALDTPNFPAEVVLDLYFGGGVGTNPLGFGNLTPAEETTTGDNYPFTYNYTDSKTAQPASFDFTFTLRKKDASNYYHFVIMSNPYGKETVLVFEGQNLTMDLPKIEGKYLSEVTVAIGNGSGKDFGIKPLDSENSVGATAVSAGTASGPGERTLHFYTDGNDGSFTSTAGFTTSVSTQYRIHWRTSNATRVNRLTLKYTNTLPTR